MAYMRLGDLLVSSGIITGEQLEQALALPREDGQRLGDELFLREVRKHLLRIHEDRVPACRTLVGDAVLVQQVAQQPHLPDAGVGAMFSSGRGLSPKRSSLTRCVCSWAWTSWT